HRSRRSEGSCIAHRSGIRERNWRLSTPGPQYLPGECDLQKERSADLPGWYQGKRDSKRKYSPLRVQQHQTGERARTCGPDTFRKCLPTASKQMRLVRYEICATGRQSMKFRSLLTVWLLLAVCSTCLAD